MSTVDPRTMSKAGALLALVCIAGILGVCIRAGRKQSIASQKQETAPVTLGIGMVPLASLAIIADAEGLFAREGVTVTVRKFASGKLALDAMLAGELQVATAAVTPVVFSSFNRQDFSVVAGIGSSDNDTWIVARRDRGIAKPQDLKGRRIATQEASAVHFFLHMFLLKQGLSEKDVTICNLTPADFPQALARGDVDACSLREPLISQATALLGANAITFEEPELYVEYYNLVADRRFLEERPETARHLLRALFAAETFAKDHPQHARSIVARAFAVDDATLNRLWPCLDLRVRLSQSLLVALEDQARWAIGQGLAKEAALPNYLKFIQPDAMDAVRPSAVSIIR